MLVECKKSKHHGFYDSKKDVQCRWCDPVENKSTTSQELCPRNGASVKTTSDLALEKLLEKFFPL